MSAANDLQVQCFAKRNPTGLFAEGSRPSLLYVSHVRPNTNQHPRILHSHAHHLELLLICGGSSSFMIHNSRRDLQVGDMVIYNAGVVHDDLTGPDTEIEYYCVAIGDLQLPGLRENALMEDDSACVYPTGSSFPVLKDICDMMFRSLAEEEQDAANFCRGLLESLLTRALTVIRQHAGSVPEKTEDEDVLGVRIKNYIDAHYREPLTLQEIGNDLNVSSYYMSHVFKRATGYSPIQYLLRRRLGEAQTLLISTSLSIAEIAGLVGFDTQNYFNAQFTKHVGVPPKQYRENYVIGNRHKKTEKHQNTK